MRGSFRFGVALLALILLWLGGTGPVGAQDLPAPDLPAAQAHEGGKACAHCHEDPHGGGVTGTCDRCHTEESFSPSTFTVDDHGQTKLPLTGQHATTACDQCHTKGKLTGLPLACAECHIDRHRGKLGDACKDCHSTAGFTPVEGFVHAEKTGFAVDGPHAGADCADCHKGVHGTALRHVESATCGTCHAPDHGGFRTDCVACHTTAIDTFADARKSFDHRTLPFPLERRHKAVACAGCHSEAKATPSSRCQTCHVDPHAGQAGMRCDDCHRPDRWSLARYDHDSSSFPLRGRHFVTPCGQCHTNQRWRGLPQGCWDCHAQEAAQAPRTVDAHGFGRVQCDDCHNSWSWRR